MVGTAEKLHAQTTYEQQHCYYEQPTTNTLAHFRRESCEWDRNEKGSKWYELGKFHRHDSPPPAATSLALPIKPRTPFRSDLDACRQHLTTMRVSTAER